MSEELKTITIADDGDSYQYAISNQVEFDRLLESSLNTPKYLETVDTKLRVLGYASLVDGGTYTGMASNTTNHTSTRNDTPQRQQETTPNVAAAPTLNQLNARGDENPSINQNDDHSNKRRLAGESADNKKTKRRKKTMKHNQAEVILVSSDSKAEETKNTTTETQLGEQEKERQLRKAEKLEGKAMGLFLRPATRAEAIPLFKEVVTIQLKVLGDHHMKVASSCCELALALQSENKYEEAIKIYRQALEVHFGGEGDRRSAVAYVYYNMGDVLLKQVKYEEAMKAFRQALDIQLEVSGNHSRLVARIYDRMGNVLTEQIQHSKARAMYQESLAIHLKFDSGCSKTMVKMLRKKISNSFELQG